MSDSNLLLEDGFEPERYELSAVPAYDFTLTRRTLLKLLGGGLILVVFGEREASAQESGGGRRGGGRAPQEISAWVHIWEDGTITAYTGKVEVGQNARTSLAQAVAEELHVPASSIRMVIGDTAFTPYDAGTFGSRTTPAMSPQLRRAAAAAREALIDLAAERWSIPRASITIAEGRAKRADTGQTLTYGQLTRGQKLVKSIGPEAVITPPAGWKVSGTSTAKQNGRGIVTGSHRYTSDVKLPGMLVGKVLRPPALNSTLVSLDDSAAKAMPGVTVVRDGDFVGVTAPSAHAALQAIEALKAEWKTADQPSSKELFPYLKANVVGGTDRRSGAEEGLVEKGLSEAAEKLANTYYVSYIAHVPLEPRAAVAVWSQDQLKVWTGTQRPFGVRSELAQAFGTPEEKVRVIVPDTGSGYGGKHTGEAAVEAARLARAAGKPVKLVWTRAEEFQWAYFRPAGVIEVKAGADKEGKLTAWEFHNINSGASAIRTPYAVPNQKIAFHNTKSPLRQGSYRALASTANNFAREAAMDELAEQLKIDPLEFRRRNLTDARLRAVLDAAAERFGWSRFKPEIGKGRGIACGTEKGGFVATCAEVAYDQKTNDVRVVRLVAAFECGAVVNPNHLKNQIEGALMMGLGGALFEEVNFEKGRLLNGTMTQYRVPRFSDTPQIDVVLVDRKDLPSEGAGECPIIAVAPAVGNAVADAMGLRINSLPFSSFGLRV